MSKKHKKSSRVQNIVNNKVNNNKKSIIKKHKKKHDKIVLLVKSKLNSIEVLISNALIDSSIIHDEFVSIDNVLRGCYNMKEEIKNSNNK